jgi:hypothetical protein
MCPDVVAVHGQPYATFADAAAALSCDTTCVYKPRSAALLLYCHARGEVTEFVAGAPGQTGDAGCPDVYYYDTIVGSGFTTSPEAFEQSHPCH